MKPFALRALLVAVAVVTAPACASSPPPRQRPIEGSVADRMLAIQESMFALIVGSRTSEEAADKIARYCEDERAAIEQLAADSEAIGEGPEAEAIGAEIARRSEKLVERAAAALEDREEMLTDGNVVIAMARCRAPAADAPRAPVEEEVP